MDSNSLSIDKNKDIRKNESFSIFNNINSNYILSNIYANMNKKKSLEIIKYNKNIQNRINFSINDYKEYSKLFSSIEIEIIPVTKIYGKFINLNKNEELFYHIYFNDNKEEIKHKYKIDEEDKVTKIKIIINYPIKSFKNLFKSSECIESINFKKFYRNNIKKN